jgi:hypothetical protein
MLVISAGMQKSGSAYIYNIINDLLMASGGEDARRIKEKYDLDGIMKWRNNNIGDLKKGVLIKLLLISFWERKFAVKTHKGPSRLLELGLRVGLVKIIYIYRDPRDVVLSVIDHGKKIIAAGENHTFAQMVRFEDALTAVMAWIKVWDRYFALDNVLKVKYEDLLAQPESTITVICKYLGIKVELQNVQSILWKYHRDNHGADMTGLHFNKAKTERYHEELSEEQLIILKEKIGDKITRMGYRVQ